MVTEILRDGRTDRHQATLYYRYKNINLKKINNEVKIVSLKLLFKFKPCMRNYMIVNQNIKINLIATDKSSFKMFKCSMFKKNLKITQLIIIKSETSCL